MSDEIDTLGSSLLSRQRLSRKRTEKRLRKDTRNQALLDIGATGVRLANKYLQDRARNFIDNNEEIAGQRLLHAKQLENKERLITEYNSAQANPRGELDWLATNKFAPIIRQNLTNTFNTTGYSEREINAYVYDTAMEEAKKYQSDWNSSIDNAFKTESADNFEAYLNANNGRADNVGGFLFNRINRSLNDRTQEDVDNEIIESLKNNRFVDNARQQASFDSTLQAGLDVNASRDLAIHNKGAMTQRPARLEDYGIGPEEITMSKVEPEVVTWFESGREFSLTLNKVTLTNASGTREDISYEPLTVMDNGVERIVNENLYNRWLGSPESNGYSNLTAATTGQLTTVDLYEGIESGNYFMLPREGQGTQIESTNRYGMKGRYWDMPVYAQERGLSQGTPTIVGHIRHTEWEEELTDLFKQESVTDGQAADGTAALRNMTAKLRVPGDPDNSTLSDLNVLDRMFSGTEYKYDNLVREDTDFAARFRDQYRLLGKQVYLGMRTFEEMGIPREEAYELAAAEVLAPAVSGYNLESKTVIQDENSISSRRSPMSTVLYANQILQDTNLTDFSDRALTPEQLARYASGAAIEIYNEYDNARGSNSLSTTFADKLKQEILTIPGVKDIEIVKEYFDSNNLNDLLDKVATSGGEAGIKRDDDNNIISVSVEKLLTFAAGESMPTPVERPIVEAPSVDTSGETYRRMGEAARNDLQFAIDTLAGDPENLVLVGTKAIETFKPIFNTIINSPRVAVGSTYNLLTQPNIVTRIIEKAIDKTGIPPFLEGLGFPSIPTPPSVNAFFQGKGQELTAEEISQIEEWAVNSMEGEDDSPK